MKRLKNLASILKKIMTQEKDKKLQLLDRLLRNKKEKRENNLEHVQEEDPEEHPFFEPKIFYAKEC